MCRLHIDIVFVLAVFLKLNNEPERVPVNRLLPCWPIIFYNKKDYNKRKYRRSPSRAPSMDYTFLYTQEIFLGTL